MSSYKIGATEQGDAGLDLSWADKLDSVDGAILITKNLTEPFIDLAIQHKSRAIVHIGCTGLGGSIVEPNTPPVLWQYQQALRLVELGFPQEKLVVRIDPIIPTHKGLDTAKAVFLRFMDSEFARFRVSVFDAYPHVRQRFRNAGITPPYGDGFSASAAQFRLLDDMLRELHDVWAEQHQGNTSILRIECCAEPKLKVPIRCGCISHYDLELLGLSDPEGDFGGYQRSECLCYAGKRELLANKRRCPHQCLYCYWKD